ncbi:eCIS core domain-containing protein [Nostoc sp.]|uniref:eCIS core domain-containing protein n=1 Tax=Nostoc sp. TaxID=1180 RepID=UPI002FFAD0ED
MINKRIAQTNQQQKSETSQASGILQRTAVRSVSDAGVQSTDDLEGLALSNSAFSKDFSRVPISTTQPQPIQAKLRIGAVGDKYEQEADRVASQVVQQINTPSAAQSTQRKSLQRQDAKEEEIQTKPSISILQRSPLPTQVQLEAVPEDEKLQAKSIIQGRDARGAGEVSKDVESAINSARGSGQALDAGLQRSIGWAMGADFSGVKVHTDSQADQLNQSIQAKAFTTGQDVFFRQGEYNPGSRGGQELIAHELTHVVQQHGGAVQRKMKAQNEQTQVDHLAIRHKNITPSAPTLFKMQTPMISPQDKAKSKLHNFARPITLYNNIPENISDDEKVDQLLANFRARTDFQYTGERKGGFGATGDCGTLVSEFLIIAKAILKKPDAIKGKEETREPFFIKDGGNIIGDLRTGNVDGGRHWIFDEHVWVIYNGQVIDVLFGRMGQRWIRGTKKGKEYKFEGRNYYKSELLGQTTWSMWEHPLLEET